MPALIIPPGFALVAYRFTCTGDPEEMLTTIGVRTVGDPVDPDVLAANLAAGWIGAWPAADLSNTWVFQGTRVWVGNDGDPLVGEAALPTSGTGSNASLPNNCAILVQKRTALGGRRNRGRMFIPAGYLPEIGVDQTGTIAAPTRASIQGNATDLLVDIETGTATADQAVVLHSSAPSAPTPVTSLTVATKIATQRKRMRP